MYVYIYMHIIFSGKSFTNARTLSDVGVHIFMWVCTTWVGVQVQRVCAQHSAKPGVHNIVRVHVDTRARSTSKDPTTMSKEPCNHVKRALKPVQNSPITNHVKRALQPCQKSPNTRRTRPGCDDTGPRWSAHSRCVLPLSINCSAGGKQQ